MAKPEQEAVVRAGPSEWNRWRREHLDVRLDLSGSTLDGIDLSGADLSDVNLIEAKLTGANLRSANLAGSSLDIADLSYSDLTGANLSAATLIRSRLIETKMVQCALFRTQADFANARNADLTGAFVVMTSFRHASLAGANLGSVKLFQAILQRTILDGTRFTETQAEGTLFGDVDLGRAVDLETVRHRGPSTIGADTILRSGGDIPAVFLRGAGVPNSLITYARSLIGRSDNQFYSCFISYSSRDQAFADQLHKDLQNNGVRCWLATEDLKIGDPFRARIDESIRAHDKLLLLLSEHSVRSRWVASEVEAALDKEQQFRQTVLFPVRVDDAVMETTEAWASEIRRTRHIGNFLNWKEGTAYRGALDRLLRDLRADPEH